MTAPEGLVPRRRSLALDDADAENEEQGQDLQDGEIEEAEPATNLASKYAAPAPTKPSKAKKKEEQVGPSGLPYTPLEKQFMEIKAENPDVLLLTEGQ